MLKHFLGYRIGNLLYLIEAAYVCGLAAGHAQPPTAGGGGGGSEESRIIKGNTLCTDVVYWVDWIAVGKGEHAYLGVWFLVVNLEWL